MGYNPFPCQEGDNYQIMSSNIKNKSLTQEKKNPKTTITLQT